VKQLMLASLQRLSTMFAQVDHACSPFTMEQVNVQPSDAVESTGHRHNAAPICVVG
jgi:hypothetical protein